MPSPSPLSPQIKFQNAAKEDMRMDNRDEREEHRALAKEYEPLTTWWKEQLREVDSMVSEVKITTRLTTTPCIVVSGTFGWSAHMEKIMMAQALGDPSRQRAMRSQKILEVNPRHPMVSFIKDRFEEDGEDEDTKLLAQIMYDTALLGEWSSLDTACAPKMSARHSFLFPRQRLPHRPGSRLQPFVLSS